MLFKRSDILSYDQIKRDLKEIFGILLKRQIVLNLKVLYNFLLVKGMFYIPTKRLLAWKKKRGDMRFKT